MTKILVAQNEAYLLSTVAELKSQQIVTATRYTDALTLIKEVDLSAFIIGIHFDDSRAAELISKIRVLKHHKDSPILLIRLGESKHPDVLREIANMMKVAYHVADYLELENVPSASRRIKHALENMQRS